MVAKWRFEPKRRSQKSRDPMQASFFTNSSIDDDTHALVREAIQNSLDAKATPDPDVPVLVRFRIGTHPPDNGVMARYLPEDAWRHFNAPDNGLVQPPCATDQCRFLVFEDFNTSGLVGDERAHEDQPGNSFYYFLRAEGQSGKQDGERGRHGIGKYVFPYTSGIRMFLVATVRSSDNKCLIAGQCVLKSHHADGQRYTPDGWWGAFEQDGEDDYFQLPVEDEQLLRQLKEDFGLARERHESGLSLVMPYVQREVTADKIAEHVIREYFWPILSKQLVVEITDEETARTIDSDTIHLNLDELLPQESIEQVSPFINLAVRALSGEELTVIELNLPDTPSVPKWDKDYLTRDKASDIHAAMNKTDAYIRIRCPLYVQKSRSAEISPSHFDIYLSKETTDVARKPLFVREGITIPEDRVPTIRDLTSIVVIEAGSLATLLGDAENPAHTEWEKNATRFKGKYKWGPTTIDFVRLAVGKLFKLLSQVDEEEDVTVLSDIFYLELPENEEDVPETRKRKKRPATGPETEPNPNPPPSSRPRTYHLSKTADGFVLKGPTEPLRTRRSYNVRIAYDFAGASKARAMKQYHKNDFDLSRGKSVQPPVTKKLDDLIVGGNTLAFTAVDNNFRLEVSGFDPNRDIIVDVESAEVADETV